jgi:hypothetical protein
VTRARSTARNAPYPIPAMPIASRNPLNPVTREAMISATP